MNLLSKKYCSLGGRDNQKDFVVKWFHEVTSISKVGHRFIRAHVQGFGFTLRRCIHSIPPSASCTSRALIRTVIGRRSAAAWRRPWAHRACWARDGCITEHLHEIVDSEYWTVESWRRRQLSQEPCYGSRHPACCSVIVRWSVPLPIAPRMNFASAPGWTASTPVWAPIPPPRRRGHIPPLPLPISSIPISVPRRWR